MQLSYQNSYCFILNFKISIICFHGHFKTKTMHSFGRGDFSVNCWHLDSKIKFMKLILKYIILRWSIIFSTLNGTTGKIFQLIYGHLRKYWNFLCLRKLENLYRYTEAMHLLVHYLNISSYLNVTTPCHVCLEFIWFCLYLHISLNYPNPLLYHFPIRNILSAPSPPPSFILLQSLLPYRAALSSYSSYQKIVVRQFPCSII